MRIFPEPDFQRPGEEGASHGNAQSPAPFTAWRHLRPGEQGSGRDGKKQWSRIDAVSTAALDDFKHPIRQLTGRSWGVSMEHRLHKLGEYLRGWVGYFGISQYYRPVPGIDDWIRRRLRMCYWKQWRLTRTKVRWLLNPGVSKKQAIFTAIIGKSDWRLSKALATNSEMTNAWLKQQGLISFRDLWMQAQGYV
ncbi:MAG: maturase [Gammaproteobacteria bacterium]|nr:maturase [Gammaproteobacteria bacterium]